MGERGWVTRGVAAATAKRKEWVTRTEGGEGAAGERGGAADGEGYTVGAFIIPTRAVRRAYGSRATDARVAVMMPHLPASP